MNTKINRRNFLKAGTGLAGALLFPITKSLAETCGLTPAQTAGPFYPGESQFHPDNDLTFIPGHAVRAEGQIVIIKGKVLDTACKPVSGVDVEIWQACASGKYNNKKDPNPAPIDPHFKYWGETLTDAEGNYSFKTIIPGAYPADPSWMRPPHIHFKISKLGYRELITQMYFAGDPRNEADLILEEIPESERASVIVEFKSVGKSDILEGNFNITLRSFR